MIVSAMPRGFCTKEEYVYSVPLEHSILEAGEAAGIGINLYGGPDTKLLPAQEWSRRCSISILAKSSV